MTSQALPRSAVQGASPDRRGAMAGMSAYILWGFITVYWKALGDFAPLELIGYRIVMSVLFLVVILALRGRLKKLFQRLSQDGLWVPVTMASLLLAVNWTTYVVVVSEGKVIEAALGYFIAPLGTMLLGVKVLHEKLRPIQIASAMLALVAVLILTFGYGRLPVYALAMATSWALYGMLKRQVTLQPLESLMSETLVLIVPAIGLIIWFSRYENSVVTSATSAQWTLVALSGLITAVPLLLFAAAALKLPLTVLGPMQYSVPVINFLLGWLVYHEDLSVTRVIGFSLIWVALVIATLDSIRESRSFPRLETIIASGSPR
jgi:chloramphenicol-sensitive protein RarD